MNGQESQANVEYFFRLLYDLLFGGHGGAGFSGLAALAAKIWLWIIAVGYALSVIGLVVIVYCLVRLFELREHEEHAYGELVLAPESAGGENPRWTHIESLMAGDSPSQWREAILEADIMLDDMLSRQGYSGEGVGEKLKQVEASDFATLQEAWEAHRVRNEIAHSGSRFDLSETLARRTIARYEAVFREFHAI